MIALKTVNALAVDMMSAPRLTDARNVEPCQPKKL
jgi:hypothetical protein